MLEKLKEYKETLAEKIRSPFALTFLVVWCIYHWRLLMLLFFEDKTLILVDRLQMVKHYSYHKGFMGMVIYPILFSLSALILYTISNSLGLAIKLFYDKWISPFIQKSIDKNSVATIDKLNSLKRERANLIIARDKEKEKNISIESELKELRKGIQHLEINSIKTRAIPNVNAIILEKYKWYFFAYDSTGKVETYDYFQLSNNTMSSIFRPNEFYKSNNVVISEDNKIMKLDFDIKNESNSLFLLKHKELFYTGFNKSGFKIDFFANKSTFRVHKAIVKTPFCEIDITDKAIYFIANKNVVFNSRLLIERAGINNLKDVSLNIDIVQVGKSGISNLEYLDNVEVNLSKYVIE